ncbi:hypothetical protein DEDE109153_10555 [Deinococcus deserti]|uniref:Lipoprotein n=1 Tax=Deinococcus deserti (strain DSM 17065 / CIP 109153 / LMG 22923 / VCD115) TaxID=546414 RepID=C1CX16_DEIDV|nr:hypothetical protein [Deinococcus deserti]ACO46733.1 Conserved hypothetical protein, precursor [Deinococcus deserti VCD115]
MRRFLLPVLCLLPLMSCAPAATGALSRGTTPAAAPVRPAADTAFRAAFSNDGVAWVTAGQACVARAPSFRAVCPRLPAVTDVAWNGGEAWAAVPAVGAVVTLDGAPRSVPVGRVVTLSAGRVYREDGSATTFAGAAARGVMGAPTQAVTDGQGEDYVLLNGSLRRVSDGVVLERVAGPYLVALPSGARTQEAPEVVGQFGSYRLANGRLEARDALGQVRHAVPHGPGQVGVVGQWVVTVSPAGTVRLFDTQLEERSRL